MKLWQQDPNDSSHMKYSLGRDSREVPRRRREGPARCCSRPPRTPAMSCSKRSSKGTTISEEMIRTAPAHRHALRQADAGPLRLVQGVPRRAAAARRGARLPAVAARSAARARRRSEDEGRGRAQTRPDSDPFSALAFKTVSEKHGDLVFLRIYSGELRPGDTIANPVNKKAERISHIYRLFGDRRDRLEVAGPGEIVAVVGLKQTHTGHTLCVAGPADLAGGDSLPRAGDLAVDHAGQERR